jgi:hypothetical protein
VSSSKAGLGAGSAYNSGMGGGGDGTGAGRRAAGGSSSAAVVLAIRDISASKGERGLPCTAEETKRDMTSRAAEIEAAAVCARSMEGSALVGRLLAQAETTSETAW